MEFLTLPKSGDSLPCLLERELVESLVESPSFACSLTDPLTYLDTKTGTNR